MVYVKNNGRYALAFMITRANGYEFKIELDRKRVYLDTGNIATTGITAVSDEDYALLEKIPQFKARIDSKEFEITDKPVEESNNAEAEKLKKENEQLKQKLAEQKAKSTDKESKKALEAKDKEIASLKARLEKLTANKEVEGF